MVHLDQEAIEDKIKCSILIRINLEFQFDHTGVKIRVTDGGSAGFILEEHFTTKLEGELRISTANAVISPKSYSDWMPKLKSHPI